LTESGGIGELSMVDYVIKVETFDTRA